MPNRAALACVTALTLCVLTAQAADPAQAHVILVTIDGFPSYLLNQESTSVPTLRALAKRGVVADGGMRVTNPSVTWPNHTTLVTGVRPKRHSVLFNGVLVRREPGQPAVVEPKHDQAELVAVPTVFDLLHASGLSTAGINWPCTRNAPGLDVNFPDVPEQVKYMTAPLRDELVKAGVLKDDTDAGFRPMGAIGHDRVWLEAACRTIRERKSNFMLFHLLNMDAIHHKYGAQTMASQTAAGFADDCIRDLVKAVDDAGIRERTTIFVVADHGFSTAGKVLFPNVLLHREGFITASPVGSIRARVHAIPEGGSALIYCTDPATREADVAKVLELFKDKEGLLGVYEPKDYDKLGIATPAENKQAPDLVLAAKDGYAFDGIPNGEEWVTPAILGRHTVGNHGYVSDNPKMNALFIASGRGIAAGTRVGTVNNVDVAPTIAHLFGKEMKDVDGKVMREILAKE